MKISLRSVLAWLTNDEFQRVLRDAQTLYDNFRIRGMEVPAVSYEDAVKFFVEHQPIDSRVAKGALMREFKSGKTQLTWEFLDNDNQILCGNDGKPYGRRVVTDTLDSELLDAFGDKSVMIFQ